MRTQQNPRKQKRRVCKTIRERNAPKQTEYGNIVFQPLAYRYVRNATQKAQVLRTLRRSEDETYTLVFQKIFFYVQL